MGTNHQNCRHYTSIHLVSEWLLFSCLMPINRKLEFSNSNSKTKVKVSPINGMSFPIGLVYINNDLKKNNHIYIIFQWPLQFAMQTNWHIYFLCPVSPVMNAWCTNIKSKDLVFIHIGQVQCLLWLFRKTWQFDEMVSAL
jgi:hypothetical protein